MPTPSASNAGRSFWISAASSADFLTSPACGGGRIASSDAMRVGALSTWGSRIAEAPPPQPSPASGRAGADTFREAIPPKELTASHNPAAIRPGRHIYPPLTMLGLVICCGARFGLLEPGDKGNIFANGFRVFADGVRRTVP